LAACSKYRDVGTISLKGFAESVRAAGARRKRCREPVRRLTRVTETRPNEPRAGTLPYMGTSMSRTKTWPQAPLSCFLCSTDLNFGRDHPFVRPLRSPSFRPDPRALRPVAHRASQGWPLSKCFNAHYISRPFLDWPEQDGKLGRVGG
jgi:hypothetical protein